MRKLALMILAGAALALGGCTAADGPIFAPAAKGASAGPSTTTPDVYEENTAPSGAQIDPYGNPNPGHVTTDPPPGAVPL